MRCASRILHGNCRLFELCGHYVLMMDESPAYLISLIGEDPSLHFEAHVLGLHAPLGRVEVAVKRVRAVKCRLPGGCAIKLTLQMPSSQKICCKG